MKRRKIVLFLMVLVMAFIVYKVIQKDNPVIKTSGNHTKVERVEPKHKVKSYDSTKEAKSTLEASDRQVSDKEKEKVKRSITVPIDYLVKIPTQSDIKGDYQNKLSITNPTVAQTVKTMLMAGYHFDLESLQVYESDASNVYQFTINLVTDKRDKLSLAGNYVLGTDQFEIASVHGTPVNVVF
ncbi:TPA: hypothetical protein ACHWZD_001003 [Streptococcus agalactiae]|jgi:hypothetical protein|uniref:Uncharacterized protein n=4 Tax=Bacilli TaxID=91061 RepID=Q8DX57_STRA5|nr:MULTISPECIES: hypothetical protein [Streptococcus]EPU22346.1 hypothetical protein SAG0135_05435 [Streptococcus agalactiae LMG 14609]EPX03367.1 hypothetical protein SAG0148_06320 [Streptococcus agalactiae MRI Z1-049]HEO8209489.1 hypothetical protein [Streptococcus agalactiae ADL-350]AAN00857.1 hypothetical protein SAG1997 [Streptococcus agalactiae 2603V/R]ARC25652.1 hypothetical protein A6J68_11160 [Streptococcus sp. 'group B']